MTTITIKRDLLEIALRYASDQRLVEDESDKRKRNETNQDHADRISSVMQRNEDLREFIQELEAALAAQPSGPAWHDAPDQPGIWLCDEEDICYTWTAHSIEILDIKPADDARWFGPIPAEDTK